jgi:hypothetical protein
MYHLKIIFGTYTQYFLKRHGRKYKPDVVGFAP